MYSCFLFLAFFYHEEVFVWVERKSRVLVHSYSRLVEEWLVIISAVTP